jgi:acyl transferase domain-containing protein
MLGNTLPKSFQVPIAIIGASCRLPKIANVQEFWEILRSGRDVITEAPLERRLSLPGCYTGSGGFLDEIDGFDASFFGMSPHEALRLDPHHRLLMETAWEAIEDAGLTVERLAGSRTGVYTSCFALHYWNMLRKAGMDDIHTILGAHRWSVPAGRITHLLDLRGPSVGIEATCASSLAAVHVAGQAIRTGEIDLAIVGAANLLLSGNDRTGFAEAGLISPTSRCRFGDENADGYVPAEGAVTLILKPLDAAVADGDRIYATILSSAVSSNGRQALSPGGTGTAGQEEMLRLALHNAGVEPGDVDYVEAHGPGTPAGDTVELTALSRVLGVGREPGQRCLVGSVKSNLGHTEAAAGLTGLLKTALALRHRTVPATLHVRRTNPVLREADTPVELAVTTQPLPDRGRPAIAGVTALGMFGVGAHVVLTEAPQPVRPRKSEPVADLGFVLPLSARDPEALRALAAAYADTLAGAAHPADVCYSAGARRTHLSHRAAVVGTDGQELIERLRQLAEVGTPAAGRGSSAPRVVFVCSGQGSQWPGMARDLLATDRVFAERMGECDELIRAECGASVLDLLQADRPLDGEREIQPALWAIQVGLAARWRHWGIEPDLVIGHSMGEVAAATISGALSPRDGAAVISRRGELVGLLEPGAMVAVHVGERMARAVIGHLSHRVHIAVTNSENMTVLAGDPESVAAVVEPLRRRGVFCRYIQAGFASHSPHVEPLQDKLVDALRDIAPRPATVRMHSTALNRVVAGTELGPDYWMANLRNQVRFGSAVRSVLAEARPTLFIELSPHPVLVPAIEEAIEARRADAAAIGSLRRGEPERTALLAGLGAAYLRGAAPDWSRVHPDGRLVSLPTYPWRRKRFWVTPPEVREALAPPPPPEPEPEPASTRRGPVVIRSVADLTDYLVRRAAEVLSAAPETVDPNVPLVMHGMDSLLAAKLRARLKQQLDLHVPVGELLGSGTLTELAARLHSRFLRHHGALAS